MPGYSFAAEVLARRPLLWLRMLERAGTVAKDSSGSGNDGTYTDNFTLDKVGPLYQTPSRAVQFDGSDAYVATSLACFTGQRTFAGFANRTDTSGIHGLFGGSSVNTPMLRLASGGSSITWHPDSASTNVTFDNGWPSNGVFHFWMLTFDNSTFDALFYLDGAKNGATKNVGNGYNGSPGNFQGSGRGTFQDNFKGTEAEFMVFPGILTLDDHKALYQAATRSPRSSTRRSPFRRRAV